MLTFSASGTNCFIAVNGSVVSVQAGNFTLPNTTNVALFIGGAEPGGNQWFRGGLDDIRIYNRALSSNEVAQVYAAEAPPTCEATVILLQTQLAAANATNALLQAQLTAANNANAALQAQIALLQAANSNQQAQLITAGNTIAHLQSDLSAANGVISTLQARIASLEAANATLQAQLAAANSLNQQLQLQVNSIAQSITRLEDIFADDFGDPTFMIEGATLELQVSNLVMAIETMNHGQQLSLKKILSNQKNAIKGF
jgi:hypothetical protein